MRPIRYSLPAVLMFSVLLASFPYRASANSWTVLMTGSFAAVATAAPPGAGDPRLIFAAFNGDNTAPPAVLKSADGGATWQTVFPSQTGSLAADPSTPGTVYASTTGGLFRSVDYGGTWALVSAGVGNYVVVAPWNPSLIFWGNRRSVDNGVTWTAGPAFSYIRLSADPSRMVAWSGQPYQSLDQGVTWTTIPSANGSYSVGLSPTDSRYYYVGYCNQMARYRDGYALAGASGLDGDVINILVHPTRPNRVYANAESSFAVSYDNGVRFSFNGGFSAPGIPWKTIIDVDDRMYAPTALGLLVVSVGCTDADGDGFFVEPDCGTPQDCNDNDPTIHPGAAEVCNGMVDHNCDGKAGCQDNSCTGTAYCAICADYDGDSFYNLDYCVPGRPVDCNDRKASIFPGAPEIALDGIDQDCNGADLTIKVTTATWSKSQDKLVIEATSSLGANAGLYTSWGSGGRDMTWVPPTRKGTLGKWTFTVQPLGYILPLSNTPSNPGTLTVYGTEGQVDAPIKTVK